MSDNLAEDFADLAMENRRLRSRSRGYSDASSMVARRDEYLKYELRDRERRLEEIERREEFEREEQRLKDKYENKRIQDDMKRQADESDSKAEKKRIIEEYERKQREDEEDRKDDEKRLREKIEREKREAKDKEEREYQEFLQKQKEKEAKDKADKKAKEEEMEEEMRKRLSKHGYTYDQIERMISDKKEETTSKTTTIVTTRGGNQRPTYAKIKREFLSIDTLSYYDIPYEIDAVSWCTSEVLEHKADSFAERSRLLHHPPRDGQVRDRRVVRAHEALAFWEAAPRCPEEGEGVRVGEEAGSKPEQGEARYLGDQEVVRRFECPGGSLVEVHWR